MTLTVLHVIPSFAGGGAERQLVELAAALSRAGVQVHIAYLHGGPNLDAACRTGAALHHLRCAGNHDPRVVLELRSLIRRLRPSVVQTWLLHADVFGGTAARSCGVPWLLSERSSAAMYRRGVKFRLRRWLGLGADGVVANSEGGSQYWRDAGFRGKNFMVRNIVRASPPEGLLPEPGAALGPTILAVGRLSEEKNYSLMLDALELVFSRVPTATACVLGEGPERAALQARIDTSPTLSGRVSLPGYVSDVARRLAGAAVYVSLSRFEGTPNTVLEAVLQACPLVLSDIPAHRELLTRDEAHLVDLADRPGIVEAICIELMQPAVGRSRVARAKARVAEWSAERIATQYLGLYESLISKDIACASS